MVAASFTIRGGAAAFWMSSAPVVLYEGPAGTGKSVTAGHKFHTEARNHKIRVLVARKTRKSLTDSVMATYENAVLALDPAGSRIIGRAHRSHRDRYLYPNGSEVVMAGFDDPQKLLSSEYDIIYIEQSEQVLVTDVELALTRLRNNSGYENKQLWLVANPGPPTHWNLEWAKKGKATWIHSRFSDNPLYWDAETNQPTLEGEKYLQRLSRLSGVNYRRLVLGEWCGEEGQILRYDAHKHILHGRLVKETSGWWLEAEGRPRTRLEWFVVGVDWGKTGAMVVLGFDRDKCGYVVEHYYHHGPQYTTDYWAGIAEKLWQKYEPLMYICDDAEPDRLNVFNERIGHHYGREVGAGVTGPNKAILTGIAEIQEALNNDELYFLNGSLAHPHDEQVPEGQPRELVEEIDQWIWLVDRTTGLSVEKPDPRRADHAIDALRYAVMWARNRDYSRSAAFVPKPLRHMIQGFEADVA